MDSGNDVGNLNLSADNKNNTVYMFGGSIHLDEAKQQYTGVDARADTFNVALDGKQNTVVVSPGNPFMGIGKSDTLNVRAQGDCRIQNA